MTDEEAALIRAISAAPADDTPRLVFADWLTALTPDALEETVFRYSLALQARITLRRSDALLHICTHAHDTAAQVVNMIRQQGTALPQTMRMALVRQEMTRGPCRLEHPAPTGCLLLPPSPSHAIRDEACAGPHGSTLTLSAT